MSTEILETSPLYQEWVRKAREQGLREAALVLLRARFNDVPPQVAQALSAASAEQIQKMLAYMLTEDLDQLRARLET